MIRIDKIRPLLLVLIALTMGSMSCSKNENKPEEQQSGQISFDTSGDNTGSKTGKCVISTVEGSTNIYQFVAVDGSASTQQTFSLIIHKSFSDNSLSNPSPGTYPIGTETSLAETDGFRIMYSDRTRGKVYGGDNVSGSLTVTKSMSTLVEGTFTFSAGMGLLGDGVITLSNGKFSAVLKNK